MSRRFFALIAVLGLVLSGCGGGGVGTTTNQAITTSQGPTTTEAPEGLVSGIEELAEATIQIVAQGTFVDPEFGAFEAAGSGSGFIIDPSGLAVTNNHVVGGAGLIQVYVGGETRPINARILGLSECSDLAVIDLAGDGYRYLDWYEGSITPGLKVLAAGFPLGDPQFTLTQGIISKANFPGETQWASIDAILEHDARIRGGNSGGPLVTEDAQVVGVNYAGREDTDQNFAISVTEARGIVDQLSGGSHVDSVGVNGQAVVNGSGSAGIWVESVQPGSPADRAGIAGGDVITRMAGVSVGTDGTMTDFCDVVRTHGQEGVIPVEVTRWDTLQVLRGQLNGEPLAEAFSFADELEDTATVGESSATYTEYVLISDDTGAIQVEIPAEWADINGEPYTDDEGDYVVDVRAASDLDSFHNTWSTPGMIFSASSDWASSTNPEALLDPFVEGLEGQCTYLGREVYEDPAYTGFYDLFVDCGSTNDLATYVVVAAGPPEGGFLILVQTQAVGDRDFEALDHILNSFYVIGEV
jgi:serine protease Do